MSKIGRRPILIPEKVRVEIKESNILIEGPKGKLSYQLPEGIICEIKDSQVFVVRTVDTKQLRAFHGLARAIINNMIVGVSEGYKKELDVIGVGYKVQMKGEALVLQLGFSHPIEFIPPPGVKVSTPSNTRIEVSGIDKQLVGETAAKIRRICPPEPYKGKGIRYAGEEVRKKLGKAMGK